MKSPWYKVAILLAWGMNFPLVAGAEEPAQPDAAKVKPATTSAKAEAKTTVAGKTEEKATSPDELAIRRNVHEYIIAFESQDAKRLAALWAPKAIWVNGQTGERVEGRDAIEKQFAAHFAESEPGRLKVEIQSIHFTTPTVAVEDGTATVIRSGEEPRVTSYAAVHVLIDGKWYLDSIRETDLPPAPSAQDHLSQLAWLEGTWIDESEEATVVTKYHWTPNRAFLVQSFSAFVGDEINMQGTQIIGWDAAEQRIRSWMFDSDGGFSEGRWEAEGDHWVVRQSSTLPDGRRGSAVNSLTRLDDDSFTWKSSARQVNGEMLPNVPEFTVVRQQASATMISEEE